MSHKKKDNSYFPLNPGWLIVIPTMAMVYCNPYIIGLYNPLDNPTNQVLFVRGSHGKQEPSCDLMTNASPEKKTVGFDQFRPLVIYFSEVKNLRFRFLFGNLFRVAFVGR